MITGMKFKFSKPTRVPSSPASCGGNFQWVTGDNDGFRPLGQYRCPKVGEHGARGRGTDWNDADNLPARAIVCVVWRRRSAERITAALEGGWAVGFHVDEARYGSKWPAGLRED